MKVSVKFNTDVINHVRVTSFVYNGKRWFVLRHLADAYSSSEQTTALARKVIAESVIYVGVRKVEGIIDFRPGHRDSLCVSVPEVHFLFTSLVSEKNIF